ncbi:MAG: hypothetical protein AAF927_17655 [Bacteroidota bacterium]
MGKRLPIFNLVLLVFGGLTLGLGGCRFSIDRPIFPQDQLVVEEIVAFGDGYMAGFTNSERSASQMNATSGLFHNAQANSIPRLIVARYNELRDTLGYNTIPFKQPLALESGSGYLEASSIATSPCATLPSYALVEKIEANSSWQISADESFNNLSFPYLSSRSLNDLNELNENAFLARVFPNNNLSYRELAVRSNANFFLMWLGMNEVLDYALSGGEYGGMEMSTPASFGEEYETFIQALIDNGKKGMIATIPDITQFPYFRTVPRTYVDFENCGAIPKAVYIESWADSSTQTIRVANNFDRILLQAKSKIGQGESPSIYGLSEALPVSHQNVLDAFEVEKIRANIEAYNQYLIQMVDRINLSEGKDVLGIVRLDRTFAQIFEGRFETGVFVSGDHLTGGVFNLDGLYLTPRGNALVANQFIRSINAFSAFPGTLPPNNLKDYVGVSFP